LKSRSRLCLPIVVLLAMAIPASAVAQADSNSNMYRVETVRWRAAEGRFATWQRDGAALASNGALQLDSQKARAGKDPYAAGTYKGGNFYNGGSFFVGEATGPVVLTGFPFAEAIPSWNATTPTGTWIEVQLRARVGTTPRWTAWYNLGVWASGQDTIKRHSVSGQSDADAYVDVDTLKIGKLGKPLSASGYQLKFRLFSTARNVTPKVRNASVVVSTKPHAPTRLIPGNPDRWGKLLQVSECSQMVYPDGGEAWCSPTSVAMVLDYWADAEGTCKVNVNAAVNGVYDRIYRGHGNWPFNAAYAAGGGMESYVTRFSRMSQVEEWIAAGVPVIMSVSWGRQQLTGAPISTSNGHLMVLVGFDGKGNPIVNDPAAPGNETVQRTYMRAELERLWLQASGGTAYVIYPAGKTVPR
jgi:hypothetical protein